MSQVRTCSLVGVIDHHVAAEAPKKYHHRMDFFCCCTKQLAMY